jgi:hypothetical protein
MRARLLLAALGLLIGLLLAEAGVRLIDRHHCLLGFSGNFWEPHPLFGWRLTPGATGWAKCCFGDHVEWQACTRVKFPLPQPPWRS